MMKNVAILMVVVMVLTFTTSILASADEAVISMYSRYDGTKIIVFDYETKILNNDYALDDEVVTVYSRDDGTANRIFGFEIVKLKLDYATNRQKVDMYNKLDGAKITVFANEANKFSSSYYGERSKCTMDNKYDGTKIIVWGSEANSLRANYLSNTIESSTIDYSHGEDFSSIDKEIFAYEKGYESQSDYLIWINPKTQKVNVFIGNKNNWRLLKAFSCSSGKSTTPTIEGVFKYNQLVEFWDFGQFIVKNVMIFFGGYALHSRLYKKTGELYDATIGTPASHGCVRMLDEDIVWLRYYIPINTTVVVL